MRHIALLIRSLFLPLALLCAAPALAQGNLQQRVEAALAEAGPGPRFGLLVTDETGRDLIAINPDGRFIPASNTKLLTTAAAYATLDDLDGPDFVGSTTIVLNTREGQSPDIVIVGHGDARLSSAADCVTNCLATLADAVAAQTRQANDVVGDASLFEDQRWSPGMSWNNIHTRSGTGVAALSLDDNEVSLRVVANALGQPPIVEANGYFSFENRATTSGADVATDLDFERLPGSRVVVLTGNVAAGSTQSMLRLGVDDPADYAAWRLREMLEARGVRVTGRNWSRYRSVEGSPSGESQRMGNLANVTPPPLAEDIVRINKDSQNLHAELLLRRVGRFDGDGSITDGVTAIAVMMERAGAARTGWDLSDGSGMSTYNRLSPRATVALLRWASTQPWGATWRDTLPIAGVDGTLANRFRGTALEGRLFAKTGTLNASNALSGYLIAASGRTLTFSFFANDMPGGASATARMDAVLLEIAAGN